MEPWIGCIWLQIIFTASDQCMQRLHAWEDNARAAEGYEEEEEGEDEGEEEQDEGEDAEEGEYAVACKDAERSDLSTDAEEGEDAEEEAMH